VVDFTPDLPPTYQILPESIDFIIPDFKRFYITGDKTLALSQRNSESWFHQFVDRLIAACGRHYLPVCRMSDGEFLFVLGDQPPDARLPRLVWAKRYLTYLTRLMQRLNFQAKTPGHYHSGAYTHREQVEAQSRYADLIRQLSQQGILALHLSYGREPFQERFFPALGRWLKLHQITLTEQNYIPFYFVYAALTGPRRKELLQGRRVLVVNGATGEKRQQIEAGLTREGVAELHWLPISLTRSLYDRVDVTPFISQVDLAMVGAGIGKPNILAQMVPLQVPCIDAGFVFEVWAKPENCWKRPVCAPDDLVEVVLE